MTKARRPNLYVIAALKRKYGERKGEFSARDMLTDCERIKSDMAHLGAVLAMFEPGVNLAAIRPWRPYKPHRGRWSRTALDILRKATRPLRAYELARLVMSAHGVAPDRRTTFSIGCSLQAVLARLQAQGLVTAHGKPRQWAINRD